MRTFIIILVIIAALFALYWLWGQVSALMGFTNVGAGNDK